MDEEDAEWFDIETDGESGKCLKAFDRRDNVDDEVLDGPQRDSR